MRDNNLLGRWGESLAAAYLREKGFSIAATNYRSRYGEIDLIAQNEAYVVFTEVKLRASVRFAEAREFVDARKQARIRSTALFWLSHHESGRQPRFDVIEIYAPDGVNTKKPRLIPLENAV